MEAEAKKGTGKEAVRLGRQGVLAYEMLGEEVRVML